jgi:hypothetical protein
MLQQLLVLCALIFTKMAVCQFRCNHKSQRYHEEIFPSCAPLNDKPRDFFFLYHITHTGGTNMWMLADRARLPWDGMNSIFNPDPHETKEHLVKRWLTNVSYSVHPNGNVLPTNMYSWKRTEVFRRFPNSTVLQNFTLKRRYASIEHPMDDIYGAIPVGMREVNSMIIMRNPLALFMNFFTEEANKHPELPHRAHAATSASERKHWPFAELVFSTFHNYALRSLSGHRLNATMNKAHINTSLAEIGSVVTEEHFEVAAKRLREFDHHLILEDMHESTRFLCCEWRWAVCSPAAPATPRLERTHQTPRRWFGDDELYREFLDGSRWDFKLYDVAVGLALAQLQAMGVNSTVLAGFPRDSRQALLDELEQEIVAEASGRSYGGTGDGSGGGAPAAGAALEAWRVRGLKL